MSNPTSNTAYQRSQIRTMVRSVYDLQQLRIMIGNRTAGNFRTKLGMSTDGMSEKELGAQEKGILKRLRDSYNRITDGIIEITGGKMVTRLQMERNFQPDDLITNMAELFLIENYVKILDVEEQHFADIGIMLKTVPVYKNFLQGVAGIGPAAAGVLISEIDIHKAEYPSSLWAYGGLDVVQVVEYEVGNKTIRLSFEQAMNAPELENMDGVFFHKGVVCNVVGVARDMKSYSLVKRDYIDKNDNPAVRDSITYSPFLKTKLLGVIGPAFLKVTSFKVNGKAMGMAKRLELAVEHGLDKKTIGEEDPNSVINDFLMGQGFTVEREGSPYGMAYYNYKERLGNNPKHAGKSPLQKHRMALRFCVKRFLVDFYTAYRTAEGLPVASEYSEGVLLKKHRVAKEGNWQRR